MLPSGRKAEASGVHKVTDFKDGFSPAMEAAFRYWESKRAGRAMPSRRDIRLHEIPAVVLNMMLLDVNRKPLDFRIRFMGMGLKLLLHGDLTGRSIMSIPGMKPGTRAWETYRIAAVRRHANYVEQPVVGPDKALWIAKDLAMPLSEDDGEIADGLFTVLEYAPANGFSQNVA
jgi:PAS domain